LNSVDVFNTAVLANGG